MEYKKTKGLITDFTNKTLKDYKVVFSLKNSSLKDISFGSDGKWYSSSKEEYIETKLIYEVNNHKEHIDKTIYKIGNIYDIEYKKDNDKYIARLVEKDAKIINRYQAKNNKIKGIIKILLGIIILILLLNLGK